MRTVLPGLFAILIFVACSEDPKVQQISKHLQRVGKADVELNFKKIDFKKMDPFTGRDSANIIHRSFLVDSFDIDSNYFHKADSVYQIIIDNYQEAIDDTDSTIENSSFFARADLLDIKVDLLKRQTEAMRTQKTYSRLSSKFSRYAQIKDSVLYDRYKIKYEMLDPALRVRKTLTDTFYFYPGSDKIAFKHQ